MNIKKIFLNLFLSFICFIITGFGISLSIEAGIGISAFNAVIVSISQIVNIKIGTLTTIANILFLLAYIILTEGKLKTKYLLQFFGVSSIGIFINYFTYNIFSKFEINNYAISIIFLIISLFLIGISVALILTLDSISIPVEAVCLELSKKINVSFATLRRYVDIISIIISLLITFIFSKPLVIREGTIISLLLFSTIIGIFHTRFEKIRFLRELKIF